MQKEETKGDDPFDYLLSLNDAPKEEPKKV